MRCSICRDPGHTKAKCRREDLLLLHQIRALEARHARSRYRAELRGEPEDWHPELEVYLDDDRDELAAAERERATQMSALLRAWRDAGGTLEEIPGGRAPGAPYQGWPCLARRLPSMDSPPPAGVIEVRRVCISPRFDAKLRALRDAMREACGSQDPATSRAYRGLVVAWNRSPQAALWRWEQHYKGVWPRTAPADPAAQAQEVPQPSA